MRLIDSRQTTLDVNGTGTVRFGPVPYARKWHITSLNIGTTSVRRTAANVYLNSVDRLARRDVSPFDGNDATSDTTYDLLGAESLIVQWTGGTPGAVATATIEGAEI